MKRLVCKITIIILILTATAAYSYTPSSHSLLMKILKNFTFDAPISIEQSIYKKPAQAANEEANEEVIQVDAGEEEVENENEEEKALDIILATSKVYIKYPQALYIKWTLPLSEDEDEMMEGKNLMEFVIKDDNMGGVIGDDLITFDRNDFLYSYEIFSFDSTEKIIAYLDSINVDTKKVTMGLYDHTICYVIGSDDLSDRTNQLWVDKEKMLPKLIVMFYEVNGVKGNFKLEFSGYSLDKKLYFPNNVKYFSNDLLTHEFVTTKVIRAVINNDDIFSIKNIIKRQKPPATSDEEAILKNPLNVPIE